MLKNKALQPFFSIFILIIILFLLSCETPRHNPLDPGNPHHKLNSISGKILTYRVPHEPISGVNLFWKTEGRNQTSNASGFFEFTQLQQSEGWLILQQESFLTDSVYLDGSQIENLELYLNQLPVLDDLVFYSSIENRRPDRQIISIVSRASISDNDNDIDSVFIVCPPLSVNRHMTYNIEKKRFERVLSMEDLHINSPEAVAGHEFILYVKDNFGNYLEINRSIVKRIIKDEIEPLAPVGSEQAASQPTLSWELFQPGFPFRFMAEIYVDEIAPVLVWQRDSIPQSSLFIDVDVTLESNDYFWIIWCIDEFENRSASKPEKFYVE